MFFPLWPHPLLSAKMIWRTEWGEIYEDFGKSLSNLANIVVCESIQNIWKIYYLVLNFRLLNFMLDNLLLKYTVKQNMYVPFQVLFISKAAFRQTLQLALNAALFL